MQEKRNNFGLNVWILLFSFVAVYLFFFSEKGQERVNTWINLLEFGDKQISEFIVSQTDLEKDFEKTRVAKWISRKYKVSNDAVREIVEISFSAGDKFEVDPYVILAVIAIESSFNPLAESSAGALGLMQVMPLIHRRKFEKYGGFDKSLDVKVNVYVGTEILKNFYLRYGNYQRALLAYVGVSQNSNSSYPTKVLRLRDRLKKLIKKS
ncbi:lytic transglycosylase domain-containing protein [Betaproteobacteria bacterium]|nr:lytic transglycosylase domain-containing protein [Betaproteobacteria bacterium]